MYHYTNNTGVSVAVTSLEEVLDLLDQDIITIDDVLSFDDDFDGVA